MIWVLTGIALFLRSWKIGHGLPFSFYSDEGHYVYFALNMGGGDLNPHAFFHPSLYFYLCFFIDVIYVLAGLAVGSFKSTADAWQLYRTDPTIFYALNRSVSAIFGTLTIPCLYFIGKRIFDKKTGFLAALLLSISFLHLQFSQVAVLDATFTFWVLCAFGASYLAYEKGDVKYFLLSGFMAGLSATTKYQGGETLMLGPLACLLSALGQKKNIFYELAGKKVFGFFLFFGIAFTLGTPYWILDFKQFKDNFSLLWYFYKTTGMGQLGYEGNWSWIYYLKGPLVYGLGLPVLVCGILGLLLLIVRSNLKHIYVISFPVVYFTLAGFSKIRTSRYIVPILPFLCLFAAFFIVKFISRAIQQERRRVVALWLAGILVGLPSLIICLRYSYLRSFPGTAEIAYQWMEQNIPPQSKILLSAYAFIPRSSSPFIFKDLDTTVFDQKTHHQPSIKLLKDYQQEGIQYVVLDEWHQGIILVEGARFEKYHLAVEKYQQFIKDLEARGQLIQSFSPYVDENFPFDMENVEVASRSLWKMKSLGPWIKVYKL